MKESNSIDGPVYLLGMFHGAALGLLGGIALCAWQGDSTQSHAADVHSEQAVSVQPNGKQDNVPPVSPK